MNNKVILLRIGLSLLAMLIAFSPLEKIRIIGTSAWIVKSFIGAILAAVFAYTHFLLKCR
jgi:hypothetical protein